MSRIIPINEEMDHSKRTIRVILMTTAIIRRELLNVVPKTYEQTDPFAETIILRAQDVEMSRRWEAWCPKCL